MEWSQPAARCLFVFCLPMRKVRNLIWFQASHGGFKKVRVFLSDVDAVGGLGMDVDGGRWEMRRSSHTLIFFFEFFFFFIWNYLNEGERDCVN